MDELLAMLRLKQYFCSHKDIRVIAEHKSTLSNLWKCPKCRVYVVQHWGTGMFYFCKKPNIGGWK